MIIIEERTPDYHYVPYYYDGKNRCNLGDIFFDRESQVCKVRFYGWSVGIPLEILDSVLTKIKNLEEKIKNKGKNVPEKINLQISVFAKVDPQQKGLICDRKDFPALETAVRGVVERILRDHFKDDTSVQISYVSANAYTDDMINT